MRAYLVIKEESEVRHATLYKDLAEAVGYFVIHTFDANNADDDDYVDFITLDDFRRPALDDDYAWEELEEDFKDKYDLFEVNFEV